MISIIAFAVGSVPIVWVSKRSLLHPASHGFFRFIAFEAILALVVLNAQHWFVRPFGLHQLISWLMLIVSVVLVVWGVVLLRRYGRFHPAAKGAPGFEWENTESLVTIGVYGYIRHPMYASLLFLTWGALLKSVAISTVVLAGAATLAIAVTAKVEEAQNVARFGSEYRDYMRRTKRFIPFVI